MINGFTLESIVFFTNGQFTIDLNGLIDVNAPLTENNKRMWGGRVQRNRWHAKCGLLLMHRL
jgi:hypothetical protein